MNGYGAIVEPGPALAPDRLDRFSRQLLLPGFGELAQRRLAGARVLVVGAGGLGSATVPSLAAAGVGTIGIADTDLVELSNLHRQTAHSMADIGRPKLDSLADAVAAIDSAVTVVRHEVRLDSSNILGVLEGYDLVLDGSDNFPTRYLTNDAAELSNKPLVWGAILQYSGQAGVAWADRGPTYRDLFPVPPAADEVLSCADGGVLPSVCAAIGAIMASEAIKLITGVGEPLVGRVTTYDALTGRYRELSFERSPEAASVTELIDYAAFCGVRPLASADDSRISAVELSRLLDAGGPVQVIDVREPFEAEIAKLPAAEVIPLAQLQAGLDRIRADVPVVVYCHHDARSSRAMAVLREAGRASVRQLAGGIDAWAAEVDPTMRRY